MDVVNCETLRMYHFMYSYERCVDEGVEKKFFSTYSSIKMRTVHEISTTEEFRNYLNTWMY